MPTALEQIAIDRETVGHALKDRKLFVPMHQRSYAWEKEHVLDLYQDFQKAIDDGNPEYFVGSIVVVRAPGNRVEVNDGQQRLATSAILIAAIRDFFFKNGDKETSSEIERDYLFSKDRKTHKTTARLHLNLEDHDYFEKRILRSPDDADRVEIKKTKLVKESHKRISRAADLAAKHVATLVKNLRDSDKGGILHKWLDYLEDSVRVIWVEVIDARTAYFIFETMNDRGLRLSAADLLKNHILALADDRRLEAFQKWNSMCAVLDTLGEHEDVVVNYIRYFWIANNGPTRTRDLYDEIKKAVKNSASAIKLAAELELRANDYAAILTPSHEKWASYNPSVRKQVATLSHLGILQMRPLLLSAVNQFSRSELPKLFQVCISMSVRYLLSSVQPGSLEHPHGISAKKIANKEIKTVKELMSELANVIPNDTKFKSAAAIANVAKHHLARYYLRAMQMQADGGKEPQYIPNDGNEVTLEHILPDDAKEAWGHIPPDIAKAHHNRLGNQALLAGTVNSALGNAKYDVKKPALAASPFSLTQEASMYKSWGVDEIANRQEKLAELAVKTWPIKVK